MTSILIITPFLLFISDDLKSRYRGRQRYTFFGDHLLWRPRTFWKAIISNKKKFRVLQSISNTIKKKWALRNSKTKHFSAVAISSIVASCSHNNFFLRKTLSIKTLRFLSPCSRLKKKVETHFCKISHMVAIGRNFGIVYFISESNVSKTSRMVAIAEFPSWHFAYFRFHWRLEKSRILFLQNFANGGNREIAIMILGFLSSFLAFWKKLNLIFAKFREW